MKYKKGTFVVVPIGRLETVSATAQALLLWLCKFADEEGTCFPSRKKLSILLNISLRTVDTHIALLIEAGIITKTTRAKRGTKENMSNLYQIIILSKVEQNLHDPLAEKDTTPRAENVPVTIPSINSTHLTNLPEVKLTRKEAREKKELEYNFSKYMDSLINSKFKPDKIIYLYFLKKKFKFENLSQWENAVKLARVPAMKLEGYNSSQLERTMDYCEDKKQEGKWDDWSLHAIAKQIPNVVNKK